jgi:SAM-dependent methyltransferase
MDSCRPRAEWFRSAFGELYGTLYPHRDDAEAAREARALAALLGPADDGRQVVDLGCGAGRHLAALRDLGWTVTGLDLSPQLLARARRRPGLSGRLVRGDLRRLPFRAAFDVALSLFTSFGYCDDEANAAILREFAATLRPGGRLVLDHLNPPALARNLLPESERRGPGCRILERREIRDRRVRKEIEVIWDTGRRERLIEDVRLYLPEEMATLLARAGLREARFLGSLRGEPLAAESERMVVLARRDEVDGDRGAWQA